MEGVTKGAADYDGAMRSKPSFLHPLRPALKTAVAASVAALITASAGCAATPNATFQAKPGETAQAFYQGLLAELSSQAEDYVQAHALMLNLARISNDPQAYERATEFALRSRDGETALMTARAWLKAFPGSHDAARYVIQILVGLNRLEETIEPLRADLAAYPLDQRGAAITDVPRYFARVADKKRAAAVVQTALAPELARGKFAAHVWAAVGTTQLMAADPASALKSALNGARVEPNNRQIATLALFLVKAEKSQADEILDGFIGAPGPVDGGLAYVRRLVELARVEEAYAKSQTLTTRWPASAEAWLVRGSIAFQKKDIDATRTALARCTELLEKADAEGQDTLAGGRVAAQAYFLLAVLAENDKDYVLANSYLDRLTSPEDQRRVSQRRVQMLLAQGQLDAAQELVNTMPDEVEDEARAKISAEVELLRARKDEAGAYRLLTDAMVRFPQDPDLAYEAAMSADKLKDLIAMEQILRKLLAKHPDHYQSMNALGYSLADRNVQLVEARALIQKALSFAPQDPYIIDSMGWVEFRSGNLSAANTLLRTAFEAKPDAEIAAHCGEVLWALGQRDAAQKTWERGMQLNPDNETLRDTVRRLTQKP
jgi:tetratricopeptide (TPR) repeat protein